MKHSTRTTHTNATVHPKTENKSSDRDEKWNEYEPLSGTPITKNMDSSYNYRTNETTNMTRKNDGDYAPDLRSDTDLNKNRKPYDIEMEGTTYDEDSMVRNNIAYGEFDYTKEDTDSWLSPDKTPTRIENKTDKETRIENKIDRENERITGEDKTRSSRNYK